MIINRMHYPLNFPQLSPICNVSAVVFQTYDWPKILPKFSSQFLPDCENKPETTHATV